MLLKGLHVYVDSEGMSGTSIYTVSFVQSDSWQLHFVVHIGSVLVALTRAQARCCQLRAHSCIILLNPPLLVAAKRIAAQV